MGEDILKVNVHGKEVPVVFEQNSYMPIVSMQIIFRNSGSLYDTKAGLAYLSAKLLSEGTKKDGSVGFAAKLENSAIGLSARADHETLIIELSSLKSEFDKGVALLSQLLSDPNYTKKAADHVKMQAHGLLMQQKSDFDTIAANKLKERLFAGTPMSQPRNGTIESVAAITLEDMQSFITSHLGYNNAIVVIGGDITADQAQKVVQDTLSLLPQIEEPNAGYFPASSKQEVAAEVADTQQAYIYFGAPFDFKYSDPDQHIAKVAGYILGGSGFGSRLMEEIRVKRGLAYSAYGQFVTNRSSSYLSGYLQTKLANEEEAKKLVSQIVAEFVQKGVSQQELDAAKEFLVGSEPLQSETLSQRLGIAFRGYYFDRPIGYHKGLLEKIGSLKLEELNSFIKSHTEITQLTFAIVKDK